MASASSQSAANATLVPGSNKTVMMACMTRGTIELRRPCFTAGTSRVARSRASKSLTVRKRKAVSPQSPPSPNQESAMNSRTGKVAFGPWMGPYEPHPEADTVAAAPLFTDHKGNTYASLTAEGQRILKAAPEGKGAVDGAAPTAAATQQLYALVNKMALRHAAVAQTSRQPSQWPQQGRPRSGGRCGHTMGRSINQPRRC